MTQHPIKNQFNPSYTMQPQVSILYEQWQIMLHWVNGNLNNLSNQHLSQTVLPNDNHGVWILGHLIASDDDLALYMGKGDLLFPTYQQLFGAGSTVQPIENYPPIDVLRQHWKSVCDKNEQLYQSLTDAELDETHALHKEGSPPDFYNTKKRVLICWHLHQVHHAGQLALIRSVAKKQPLSA